jgi:hypothetical protein
MRRNGTLEAFFKNKQKMEKKHTIGITKIISKEDKKEYLTKYEGYKTSQNLSDDDYNRLRTKMVRDIDYIALLNEEIKNIYAEFTQYKLDVLYDFETMDKEKFDAYESKILSLKKKRDAFILKQKSKIKQRNDTISIIQKQIQERMVELDQSSKEERIQLYTQITQLKKDIFDILEPSLSMIEIIPNKEIFTSLASVTYSTLNTDYLPIHDNEKPMSDMNISPENVDLKVEEIE